MKTAKDINTWSQRLVIISIAVIAVCTLFPFSFSFSNIQPSIENLRYLTDSISVKDLVGNILLFAPLGFGWAGCINAENKHYKSLILSILLCGALSGFVEFLQLLLSERTSSFVDIIVNTFGGFLGAFLFQKIGIRLMGKIIVLFNKYLSIRNLAIVFTLYALLALSFSVYGLKKMSIANWKAKFPITLGNEQTGDRPWLGSISELWIADEALRAEGTKAIFAGQSPDTLMKDHLVAFYQLGSQGSQHDRSGTLEDLVWKGSSSKDQAELGQFSSSDLWLQTAKPATQLVKKLRSTNQFSLGLKFQTRSLEQKGPARLVALSRDPLRCNLIVGQEKKSLVVRLHMVFSESRNYVDSQFKVPRVFVDTLPHQAVITYTGELIQISVDNLKRPQSFELTPVFVMSKLQDLWFSKLDTSNIRLYKYLYYSTFFAPLGIILGIITTISQKSIQTFLLTSVGFIAPPVVLQYFFLGNEWKHSNQSNLNLSFLIMLSMILVINIRSQLKHRL
jgi:VanZ family protein